MEISRDAWKDIGAVLMLHGIPYKTTFTTRDVQRSMGEPDETIYDGHIQINITIPDYFRRIQ